MNSSSRALTGSQNALILKVIMIAMAETLIIESKVYSRQVKGSRLGLALADLF